MNATKSKDAPQDSSDIVYRDLTPEEERSQLESLYWITSEESAVARTPYYGQYIAVCENEIVDADWNKDALIRRIADNPRALPYRTVIDLQAAIDAYGMLVDR